VRFTTYSKYSGHLLESLNLQELIDGLSDFLLQSGFAGGPYYHPFWGEFGDEEDHDSLEALKEAILQKLMEMGEVTPEMLEALAEEGNEEGAAQLAEMLDEIVQRLIEEGYLNTEVTPQMPADGQPVTGPGSVGKGAAQSIKFNLTQKGLDFLGYKQLKDLLGSIGKSSFGAHDTAELSTGVEAGAASKKYEYGGRLARAPGRIPVVVRHGSHARLLALDDPLRRGSVHAGEEGGACPSPPHTHPVPGRQPASRAVSR
jgi:Ca-activated chloride channel family protein